MHDAITAPAQAVDLPTVAREPAWRVVARTAFPFLVVGALWELVAHLGIFPPRLFPSLEQIASAFVRLTAEGILPHHALDTVIRLLTGFALAAVAGVAIGIAMGRSRLAEDVLVPLVSIGAPIPGIAYAPLFLLWFGLGNLSAVLLVAFVSAFPIIFNTWTGVKAVKAVWVRTGRATGPEDRRLVRGVLRTLAGYARVLSRAPALHLARAASRPRPGVAHPGGGGNARRGTLGPRLADLRRPRVPQHRRHPGRRRRDRHHWARAREAGVPADRGIHRRALGDDDMSTAERSRSIWRAALALAATAAVYEAVARSGVFPPALLPTLPAVARALVSTIADGTMLAHAFHTLARVLLGFAMAIVVALPLGIMMARFRPVENFVLPLASALMPIPSLAWVPMFILWFGLGDITSILVVFYAATFPLLLNTWSGVRAVNPLWLRAAGAMGADEQALFWKVIIPGASPFIITGLRQAFLRSWIAVVGAEMLAASNWGLGWVIFDAKEFLNADVMLASLVVIGAIGFVFERLVFGSLEQVTVLRWGMVRAAKG